MLKIGDHLPHTAAELIDDLDKLFPPLCIRAGEPIEEAHRYAGKRELVNFLLRLKAEAEKRPNIR